MLSADPRYESGQLAPAIEHACANRSGWLGEAKKRGHTLGFKIKGEENK